MNYKKTMLCLAVSVKKHELGNGRCVAGKEICGDGFGGWVRPVSARPTEEISERERSYKDKAEVRVLDFVTVPFLESKPSSHQTENHVIDGNFYWMHGGRGTWADVVTALDSVSGPLWKNGHSRNIVTGGWWRSTCARNGAGWRSFISN